VQAPAPAQIGATKNMQNHAATTVSLGRPRQCPTETDETAFICMFFGTRQGKGHTHTHTQCTPKQDRTTETKIVLRALWATHVAQAFVLGSRCNQARTILLNVAYFTWPHHIYYI